MLAADDTICCLPQVLILDCRLQNWSHLRLLPGGDEYDYGDEYTDHGDYDHELCQMITKWSKYNMLSSKGDPGSSASKLVSPLPGPGGADYDYDECGGGDAYANLLIMEIQMIMTMMMMTVTQVEMTFLFIKIQQYLLSQDPALSLCIPSLLLRFISTLPGYDDYKRMVNDDECAVCVFVCMRVCFCLFSLKTLVSH